MTKDGSDARPTIRDIAERAGVSISAASYALNGRAGVSETTRRRVRALADEAGWAPDSAARRLAGARAEAVGLVLPAGTAETFGVAPWFMEFISGVESSLGGLGYGLLLQVVPDVESELGVYRRWSGSRRVDGIVLVDVTHGDPRVQLATELGMPTVVAGPPRFAAPLTSVWTDDEPAMAEAVHYLAALGHRDIARVGGPDRLAHSTLRDAGFDSAGRELGIRTTTWRSDYSVERGRRATREILLSRPRPTAILYDDDLSAVTGLGVARELGLQVPSELSLLAWDDSVLCQSTYPQLSAMSHDVRAYGAHVTRRLLDLLDGAEPGAFLDSTPRIVPRGSTAPPAGLRNARPGERSQRDVQPGVRRP